MAEWEESEPVAAPAAMVTTTATANTSATMTSAGPSHNSRVYRSTSGGYSRGVRGRSNETSWRQRGEGTGDRRRFYRHEEGNKKIIYVPSHRVGRIIGKGGSKIRDLEYLSETKIRVGGSTGINTDITLIGTDGAISKVEGMISELLQEYRPAYSKESNDQNRDSAVNKKKKILHAEHNKDLKDGRDFKEAREDKEIRECKKERNCIETRKANEPKEDQEVRNAKEARKDKEAREAKEPREANETREAKKIKKVSYSQNNSNSSTNFGKFHKLDKEDVEIIDWDEPNAYYDRQQRDRWDKLPHIVKDFYKEHPVVRAMTLSNVTLWRANCDIHAKRTFNDKPGLRPIPNPVLTFEQAFHQYPELLEIVHKQELKHPSPFQSQAWPILLRGDDLIGIAQSGSGKTLAFLLPALIHINGQTISGDKREGPSVLIVAPTRDLALHIERKVSEYQYKGIKSVCVYGGGDRKEQIKIVSKGVDLVIATPGRLNDLVLARHINTIDFSYIVLEEADRILDMGFESQIKKSLFDVRPDRQTIMTSATYPTGVRRLAESYMKDPIKLYFGTIDHVAVHTTTQRILFLEDNDKEYALFEFLRSMNPSDKVIIFCSKKATATHVSAMLAVKGFGTQCLHEDKEQDERETALKAIVDGTVNILVVTDVASKGIEINDHNHVVNLDFPPQIEEYVNRVGRTGLASKKGVALSFVTRQDWAKAQDLIRILQEANQEVPEELELMAQRFEGMKLKREGRGRGRGRRGRW